MTHGKNASGRAGAVALGDRTPSRLAATLGPDSRLARLARPFVNRLMPAKQTSVRVLSGPARGIRLVIYPRGEKYYWTGTYERGVQDALATLLSPGACFWDIGAHAGFFSLLAAQLVGPNGAVEAFEPMPDNRARLREAVALNKAENVQIHEQALAETSGERLLHAHGASSMWTLQPELGQADGVKVDCRTLDEMATDTRRPDLVKIDAEGAEVDVLKGGRALLRDVHPKLIVEFSGESLLGEARELLPEYEFKQIHAGQWLLS